MRTPRSFEILLVCLICAFLFLLIRRDVREQVHVLVKTEDMGWVEAHLSCLRDAFTSISPTAQDARQLVKSVVKEMKTCEQLHFPCKKFLIEELPNKYEVKHALVLVRNLTAEERCVAAVLGIGKNVFAESALRKLYPQKCEFFGADPDPANKKIFQEIKGKYFKGAISATAGSQTAVLLSRNQYKSYTVNHTALSTFIDFVGYNEVIDWMSIDIEGGEVELFPSLMKGGYFDKLDIHICQLNMELHFQEDATKEDNRQATYDFLLKSVTDKRFVFLKANNPWGREQATYYAINVESERCKRRYLVA